jgi:hypothetical protein
LGASRLVVGCSLLLVTSSLFANDAATARAAELWALARTAKGGSALDAVQSLSAGAFRRTLPRRSPGRAEGSIPGRTPPLTGDLRIDWRLPSECKRLKASTSPDGGGFGFVRAIDADETWMAPLDGRPRPDSPEMQRREAWARRSRSICRASTKA